MAILATFTDANEWLDEFKVGFTDDTDAKPEAESASTIVRSVLRSSIGTAVDTWTAETAPEVVREITSLLMASYRFAKLYALDNFGPSDYATKLEERAMMMLTHITDGTIELDGILLGTKIGQADFWPNNLANDDVNHMQRFRLGMTF